MRGRGAQPPRSAAVGMRAALAGRLQEWRNCFHCVQQQQKLAAAQPWPCARGPWRHSIGDSMASDARGAAVQRQASPPAAPHRATEAAALRAKLHLWCATSALRLPGWRGYCVCALPQKKRAAALLQHYAQGPLLGGASEGGARASGGGSASPGVSPRLCYSRSLAWALSLPLLLGINQVRVNRCDHSDYSALCSTI